MTNEKIEVTSKPDDGSKRASKVQTSDVSDKISELRRSRNESITLRDRKQTELNGLLAAVPESARSAVQGIIDLFTGEIADLTKKIDNYAERIVSHERAARTLALTGPLIAAFGKVKVSDISYASGNVSLATLAEHRTNAQKARDKADVQLGLIARLTSAIEKVRLSPEDIEASGPLTFAPVEGELAVTLSAATTRASGGSGTRASGRRFLIVKSPDSLSGMIGKNVGTKEYAEAGGFESAYALGHVDSVQSLFSADEWASAHYTKKGQEAIKNGADPASLAGDMLRSVSWKNLLTGKGFVFEAISDETDDESATEVPTAAATV